MCRGSGKKSTNKYSFETYANTMLALSGLCGVKRQKAKKKKEKFFWL